jgi:DNA primase
MLNQIEEVKNRLDIVEVIGNYIKLQKCGANYRARCPFHSEKKASFFISPARQIWHCFGCGLGGDTFKFIMQIEGMEFGDALRMLAQKTGVQLKSVKPELRAERTRLYEICELASKFFEKQLGESKAGQLAKKYLLDRGIKEESIKKWRVGYAPSISRALTDFLISNRYKTEEIKKAGLMVKSERGDYFDRFRSRIIFPVSDLNSQIVGFGGRIFGEKAKKEIAKYVNTPNTFLYDKSRTLYGLDKAKVEIRRGKSCILVEGYTDCILAHQAGHQNTVATSGTALTPSQLRILKRYSENLVTAFDMDIAGDTATKRGIDLAQNMDFNIKVITMPEGKDPADVISKDSQLWQKLIQEARSILDFYFETTLSRFNKEKSEDKREISKVLLPIIKRIPNRITQSHWIQRLARELKVKPEDIEEELRKTKLEISFVEDTKPEGVSSSPKPRRQKIEERLLSLIFQKPELHQLISENDLILLSVQTSALVSKFKKCFQSEEDFKNSQVKFSEFQKSLSKEEIDFINPLILRAEIEEECLEVEPPQEAKICLEEIRCSELKNELTEISQQIKEAEENKDLQKTNFLIKKFNELTKKIINK